MNSSTSNSSRQPPVVDGEKDGYSLEVYGLADGTFLSIHIPALVCLAISLICAVAVITYSFYHQKFSTFFSWSKSERFAIYMAVCDGLYNITHFADHFHIVVEKKLPTPKALCDFYGFLMAEFITAQNLMVCIVAINVFILVYFRKNVEFGKWDYRLLLFIFGAPAFGITIVAALGQLGPNGGFCYFDGVNGQTANMFFTTILLTSIMVINVILYIMSWYKIYRETEGIRKSPERKTTKTKSASHRAAKTMSLFVAAFFVQWWALCVYGVWQWVEVVPQIIVHFITTFSNSGGILNGIVFIIIMRRKHERTTSGSVLKRPSGSSTKEVSFSGRATDSV